MSHKHTRLVQGVCCERAPGEGEAYCAALNACGVADVCFTSDVIDIFFFGASKVHLTPAM